MLQVSVRARDTDTEHQQTDKHKLVTHNLGDIGKVRGSVSVSVRARAPCTLTYFRVGWTGICMYVHGEV